MSSGHGAVREYYDDPNLEAARPYRDNPFAPESATGNSVVMG